MKMYWGSGDTSLICVDSFVIRDVHWRCFHIYAPVLQNLPHLFLDFWLKCAPATEHTFLQICDYGLLNDIMFSLEKYPGLIMSPANNNMYSIQESSVLLQMI